ncbi:hypothetical protein ACFYNY_20430 [Streptomyces sp. NPDC006530]|uniref:hypothetical protein n=1 Tax=Streptomyces sp. NPDC006530 TaxID=3364750 RepID=UPI003674FABF
MPRTSSKAQLPLPERLSALIAGPEAAEKRRAQQHQPRAVLLNHDEADRPYGNSPPC